MTRTTRPHALRLAAALLAALATTACASAGSARSATTAPAPEGDAGAIVRARADSARNPYTEADVAFMTNMIGHHAQAIVMARLAPANGASPQVRVLADRIIAAQEDEILTMRNWLRDRGRPAPDPAAPMDMEHHAHHEMLMPGMLTPAQVKELDAARGAEFDRLFLVSMIRHHRGAVTMVKQLFDTYGAGQDETVFKFASDVNVDQTTEIARMEKMLAALLFETPSP
jgi:uncharacterized protein (DUF305 family)